MDQNFQPALLLDTLYQVPTFSIHHFLSQGRSWDFELMGSIPFRKMKFSELKRLLELNVEFQLNFFKR